MAESVSKLEKEWHKWIRAKARGSVKGDFPYADELLKQRKGLAFFMQNYIPFKLEVTPASGQRLHKPKRATRKARSK